MSIFVTIRRNKNIAPFFGREDGTYLRSQTWMKGTIQ